MDDHARRVCEPLLRAFLEFEDGNATLLDLSRLAEQSFGVLDRATAPLHELLRVAASDLEYAYFANESKITFVSVARSCSPLSMR